MLKKCTSKVKHENWKNIHDKYFKRMFIVPHQRILCGLFLEVSWAPIIKSKCSKFKKIPPQLFVLRNRLHVRVIVGQKLNLDAYKTKGNAHNYVFINKIKQIDRKNAVISNFNACACTLIFHQRSYSKIFQTISL